MRLTFQRSNTVYLKTADHLNLKLSIFCRDTASFKIKIFKVQDFGNFELSPMSFFLPNFQHLLYIFVFRKSGSEPVLIKAPPGNPMRTNEVSTLRYFNVLYSNISAYYVTPSGRGIIVFGVDPVGVRHRCDSFLCTDIN